MVLRARGLDERGHLVEAVAVLATDLVAGRQYAIRETPRRGGPMLKAEFVGPARSGKAKVRWLEGECDGLEEWLPTRSLVCPWGERRAFLRDEERAAALAQVSGDVDYVVQEAISAVMEATGESGGFLREWSDPPERVRRLWARARLDGDPLEEPLAYVDRGGWAHVSAATALRWAQAFAAAEPETVGLYVEEEERRLLAEGWQPGDRIAHRLLRENRPAFALVRDWAGQPERDLLRGEVERLQKLVQRAVGELERAGAGGAARRLQRALAEG
jgi:hypothetical protein